MDYISFLKNKSFSTIESGFDVKDSEINENLFDFQVVILQWALRIGKTAIFADCGLGKTLIQLEWARLVNEKINKPILIVAPLAVSYQTKREAEKFNVCEVKICKDNSDVSKGVNITNYERLGKFDLSIFSGIVLDESSILKDHSGATRNRIIDDCHGIPYKLACTATPAPNDYMELGNHAEFLNVMSRVEMLAMYFIHDSADTAKWRLKGHVRNNLFWDWMSHWAVMLTKPSDLGFDDNGFVLPELKIQEHFIESERTAKDGLLLIEEARGLLGRRSARRKSLGERVGIAIDLINSSKNENQWLVWCDLNDESGSLAKGINDAVEVAGRHSSEYKEKSILDFSDNKIRCLVTKPSIAGHGMNWQNCSDMVFVGLSDSYEAFYQAVRRCWRFGQKNPVNVHIVLSDREGSVLKNIIRKRNDGDEMVRNMIRKTENGLKRRNVKKVEEIYDEKKYEGNRWTLYHGDCVEIAKIIESNSIDYTIFSPPFLSLYVYSDSLRDMGNCKNEQEFMVHFEFLIDEMFRTTKHGRLVSIHCSDVPAMKERDGYIGLKDFPGEVTKRMQQKGFVYHSKVTIWKDPLIEVTRTKSIGLLHKQIVKDSSRSRQGCPDYIITFMKPGENMDLISHPDGFTYFIGDDEPKIKDNIEYSHHTWRRYASPVWMDINQSNTLNKQLAREENDERHIAPLQLDTIARCLELWSNPDDLVCSWFAGIGSEGYEALRMGRRFLGVELKKSYMDIALNNLKIAEKVKRRISLGIV